LPPGSEKMAATSRATSSTVRSFCEPTLYTCAAAADY